MVKRSRNKYVRLPYVHKAMYSVQNRPREGELVVNGMKVACVNSIICVLKMMFWNRTVMFSWQARKHNDAANFAYQIFGSLRHIWILIFRSHYTLALCSKSRLRNRYFQNASSLRNVVPTVGMSTVGRHSYRKN